MFRMPLRTMPLTLATVATLILLVAACGAAPTPTATLVPPTATTVPQPAVAATRAASVATPTTATAPATATTAPAPATATTAPAAAVSFSKDVLPLFQKNCTRCHSGGGARQGVALDSYAAVMKGGNSGVVVVAGNPDKSAVYTLVKSGAMPYGGSKLADADAQKIADWIKAGAPNN